MVDVAPLLRIADMLRGVDLSGADRATCSTVAAELRRLSGWVTAASARVTARSLELDAQGSFASVEDLASEHHDTSAADRRREQQRAKAIEDAPGFGDALADGTIGAAHVDALANATSGLADELKSSMLDNVDALVEEATNMTPERFSRWLRDRVRRLEHAAGVERNQQQRDNTFLSRRLNPSTGMIEGRFSLHPELGNQVFGCIDREVAAIIAEGERAGDREFVNRTLNRNRLAAQAWGRLLAGGHQQQRPVKAEITVIVDIDTLNSDDLHDSSICETSDGAVLPPASVRRLFCSGDITPLIVDPNGTVLNSGRTIRHANRHQRRALRAMYRTCAFAGCDMEFDRCEIHHLIEWEHGGATDLDNLIPLCSHHHHTVHDHRLRLTLGEARTLTIADRAGELIATTSPELAEQRRHSRRCPNSFDDPVSKQTPGRRPAAPGARPLHG